MKGLLHMICQHGISNENEELAMNIFRMAKIQNTDNTKH